MPKIVLSTKQVVSEGHRPHHSIWLLVWYFSVFVYGLRVFLLRLVI